MVFINKAGIAGNILCNIILVGWALKNSDCALKALSLSALIIASNEVFVSFSSISAPARYVVLFAALGRVIYDLRGVKIGPIPHIWSALLFCIVAAVLSYLGGYYVIISQLKILAFSVGVTAILLSSALNRSKGGEFAAWIMAMIVFHAIAGIAAYATGIGYMSSSLYFDGFFKGGFVHSQTLGAISGIFVTMLLCFILFTELPYKLIKLGLIAIYFVFIYLSASRTGMGITLLSITCVLAGAALFNRLPGAKLRYILTTSQMVIGGFIAVMLGLVVMLAAGDKITERTMQFVVKQEGEAVTESGSALLDRILGSRMPVIEYSWMNFQISPYIGIGFGTAKDDLFVRQATLFSAPVEKSFLPTAVLEEVGIVGAFFCLIFIGSIYLVIFRQKNIFAFGVFTAFLITNIGEAIFFSLGGIGLLGWTLTGMSFTLARYVLIPPPAKGHL